MRTFGQLCRGLIRRTTRILGRLDQSLMRRRLLSAPMRPGIEHIGGDIVRFNKSAHFYTCYKHTFVDQVHYFEASREDPLIIDCGANLGMGILYFKRLYPRARIIAFEPDPVLFRIAQENIMVNKVDSEVRLMNVAVSNVEGQLRFVSDGVHASHLLTESEFEIPQGWQVYDVECVKLSTFLTEPVDFLRMDIEGWELEVLAECGVRLRQIDSMVVEYHYLPRLKPFLHSLLDLLDSHGFRYLVNDQCFETNAAVRPPFRLSPQTRYYLNIYAKKWD